MAAETAKLKQNLSEQLDRLLNELKDIDEFKDQYSPEEFTQLKQDVADQLAEFSDSISKLSTGNISLVDDVSTLKLALHAAVSQAFRTPEIIKLFANKQPIQLRLKLAQLEQAMRMHKISEETFRCQRAEVLGALAKLNEELSPDETEFLRLHGSEALAQFQPIADDEKLGDEICSLIQQRR